MLQAMDNLDVTRIARLFDKIYETGYIPSDLRKFTFLPIPKKSNAVNCSDFRTKSLMSHVTKGLMKVMLERHKAKIDWEITPTQSGYRRGMGTRDGIDYKKAFDREKHEKLREVLTAMNFDGKDIRIIANLYWGQVAVVRTKKGNSRNITIKRGTIQGCVITVSLQPTNRNDFQRSRSSMGCFSGK